MQGRQAGLSAVASLIQEAELNPDKKFKIDIFEMRDNNYQLRQHIALGYNFDYEDRDQIHHVKWDEFCLKLFYPKDQITIGENDELLRNGKAFTEPLNARQTFLKNVLTQNKIKPVNQTKNFSIRSLESALKEHLEEKKIANITLDFHWNTMIQHVDVKQQKIVTVPVKNESDEKRNLRSEQSFQFDTLIIAEGSKREHGKERDTVQKINDDIKQNRLSLKMFNYEELGKNEYSDQDEKKYPEYHFTARLKLKDNSKNDLEVFNKKIPNDDIKIATQLKSLGWDFQSEKDIYLQFPAIHVDDNTWKQTRPNWHLKFFIVSQLSEQIFNMKDEKEKRAALLTWATLLASINYDIPQDLFELDPKGIEKLNLTAFNLNIKAVDNPVRELPGGGHIILIGNSAMTSYQDTGLGLTIALGESIATGKGLTTEDHPSFQLLIDRYNYYRSYLTNFINQEYHEFIAKRYDAENKPTNFMFFKSRNSNKNLYFLKEHMKYNSDKYVFRQLNAGGLKNKITALENLAAKGDDVAIYALAKQLENYSYVIIVKGYTQAVNEQKLEKSLEYWNLLDKKGYAVSDDIKRVMEMISSTNQTLSVTDPNFYKK